MKLKKVDLMGELDIWFDLEDESLLLEQISRLFHYVNMNIKNNPKNNKSMLHKFYKIKRVLSLYLQDKGYLVRTKYHETTNRDDSSRPMYLWYFNVNGYMFSFHIPYDAPNFISKPFPCNTSRMRHRGNIPFQDNLFIAITVIKRLLSNKDYKQYTKRVKELEHMETT